MTKKRKAFMLAAVFTIITGAVYFIYQKARPLPAAPPQKEEHVVPAKPDSFDTSSKTLLETIKLARVAAYKYDQNKAEYFLNESLALWKDTVNDFINNPPANVTDKEKWMKTVADIYQLIMDANALLKKSDYTGTVDKLDEIRDKLNGVYDVAKNNPAANRLFPLLLSVKKIKETKSPAEAKPLLDDLKMKYTQFKELPESKQQEQKVKSFEDAISEIENATPKIFPRALEKLEPAFFEIYANY